jgi:hypothetical protein
MKKLKNLFVAFCDEIAALAWTLGGTGLVLITLSGDTLRYGVWISIASLALHLIGVLVDVGKSDDD